MHHKRKRVIQGTSARLEMTPMIDVVFLLLVFFVVSISPTDVLAKLDISRPTAPTVTTPIALLRIDTGSRGYVVNGRLVSLETLQTRLTRIHALSPRTTIIVTCTADATHSQLVKLLDACAGAQIKNISLMSL